MAFSLSEADLRESPLLWYLVAYCDWTPETRGTQDAYMGKCPWHNERRASFACYSDHIHCFGGGCGIHADLAQLIGVQEFGLTFGDRIHYDVFQRRDLRLAEFASLGGQIPQQEGTTRSVAATRTQQALSVPGPLQRIVLNRLTDWWHEQLLAPTKEAKGVRDYLQDRGVRPWIIERCQVLGYQPADLDWREALLFERLFRVLEEDLENERQWYRDAIPWEVLNDEHLSFLRDPKAFACRLGVLSKEGAYRLKKRLIFSCKNRCGRGDTRFYQARILPSAKQHRAKFLNMPAKKYPFVVSLDTLNRQEEQIHVHVPGTLLTESPFGPLVACSLSVCRQAIATLGEGSPSLDQLAGIPAPIWLTQDNDKAQVRDQVKGLLVRRTISFPGEEQAKLYAAFFAEQGMEAYRLLPWKQHKGVDEWLNEEGPRPIVETMRQILARKVA